MSISKIVFTSKSTLTSMIEKMPFWILSIVVMNYFMFVLLRPRRNDREQFQRKECHSIDFQAILKPLEQA